MTIHWVSGVVDCSPREAGFDPSRLKRLEAVFENLIGQGKAQAASYALSRHGRLFASRSIGPLRPGARESMQAGTWRKIASMTKVLTALGILKCVEEGRLLMEMPVSHILPEFGSSQGGNLYLHQILAHTSGLAADPGYKAEANPDHQGFWRILEEKDWLERVARLPREHAPGEAWSYSTVGYALLGEIIARVTGEPYYRWMEREILLPLGLAETFFDPGPRPLENVCVVSERESEMLAKRGENLTRPFLAAGGAFSTCEDMIKLGGFFLKRGTVEGRRVLGATTLAAMHSIQVQVPAIHWGDRFPDWRYGLGLEPARHPLIRPGAVWGHEGAGRCAFWFDPQEEFVAAWTLPTTLDWDPDFCWTPRAILWSGLL